jgi:hypothetical protein
MVHNPALNCAPNLMPRDAMPEPQFARYMNDLVEADEDAVAKSAQWLRDAAAWPPRWYRLTHAVTGALAVLALAYLVFFTVNIVGDVDLYASLAIAFAVAVVLAGVGQVARRLVGRTPLDVPPARVSDDELSMLMAWRAHRSIEKYRSSNLDDELAKAAADIEILNGYLDLSQLLGGRSIWERNGYGARLRDLATEHLVPGFGRDTRSGLAAGYIAREHRWMPLDAATQEDLLAIGSFTTALHREVRERRDLSGASRQLSNLARAIFAFLPKVESRVQPEELASMRGEARGLVQEIIDWVSALPPTSKTEQSVAVPTSIGRFERIQRAYASYPIAIIFVMWLVISLALVTIVMVGFTMVYKPSNPDTFLMVVIPTAFTTAGILTGLVPRRATSSQTPLPADAAAPSKLDEPTAEST